ncbi:hypothetical protein ABPG77_004040 [Micractinium sp. CCAP 211/92]
MAGAAHAQEGVQVLNWWPEHPTKSFFAGKKASCVLGVRNTGQERVNVTYAAATLASPYNASMSLFNFTGQYLGDVPLGPGEETSAEYTIFFPRQLPPRDFILKVSLFYSANGAFLQREFFNETITIIEEPTWLDTQLIGLYIIGLAVLGATLYSAVEFAKGQGWIKKSKPVARPAATSSNKDEWLRGTAADPKLRKKQ